MPRLAQSDKFNIARKMLEETFEDRRNHLMAAENLLAIDALQHHYGPDIFDRLAVLPEGWLPSGNSVWVKWQRHGRKCQLLEYRRLPHFVVIGQDSIQLTDVLGQDLLEIERGWEQYAKHREQTDKEIRGALAGFTTVAQLKSEWPEAHAHLNIPADPALRPPATRIDQIMQRLSLMKEVHV